MSLPLDVFFHHHLAAAVGMRTDPALLCRVCEREVDLTAEGDLADLLCEMEVCSVDCARTENTRLQRDRQKLDKLVWDVRVAMEKAEAVKRV